MKLSKPQRAALTRVEAKCGCFLSMDHRGRFVEFITAGSSERIFLAGVAYKSKEVRRAKKKG